MTQKDNLRNVLLGGLFAVSLGGFLLHLRIHQPSANAANYIPFIAGLVSAFVLPLMFIFRSTIAYAYVLNGMFVIFGTITMAHFSIAHRPPALTFGALMLNTTLADIALAWGKFFIGKALFDLARMQSPDAAYSGKFLRYPNMGFWLSHLAGLSIVYGLGHLLWR